MTCLICQQLEKHNPKHTDAKSFICSRCVQMLLRTGHICKFKTREDVEEYFNKGDL